MCEHHTAELVYVTAAQVRARYGAIADMTLWRWLSDPVLAFPQPLRINRRRFWRLDELEEWEGEHRPRRAGLDEP